MNKYRNSKAAVSSKTYDKDSIESQTDNIYEALSIIAKKIAAFQPFPRCATRCVFAGTASSGLVMYLQDQLGSLLSKLTKAALANHAFFVPRVRLRSGLPT